MSVQRGGHTGKMFLLILFFFCQSKTEYGVIGVFHKHCALSIREGSCTCVIEELTHHIRCSEFSRNQLPNSVSDLLAPPAAQSREKSNQRGFCVYLTLIYFLPKKKSKQVILLISDFEDGKIKTFLLMWSQCEIIILRKKCMYPLTWNIHQNVQKRILWFTSH